jgi:hypothetical protein
MNKKTIWHFLPCALASIVLITTPNMAAAGSFTHGCAARDLQILMIIEERENAGIVSAERLSDIMVELMNARIVCHEGRVLDAMAIYDAIADQMLPVVSDRSRAREIR